MKKLILSGLILATIGVTIISCNKEKVEPVEQIIGTENLPQKEEINFVDENDYSQLKVNNGVLEFGSIEYYETFLDDSENPKTDFLIKHIEELNFNSYSKVNQDREEDLIDDDFIASILNENQVVKIDKWFIKLNFETEKVYASSNENSNAYELVLREDEESELVYPFTMDEEVLVYLNNPELLNDRGLGCSDRKATKRSDLTGDSYIATIGGLPIYMNIEAKYVKAGIYFALKAEGIHTNAANNVLNYWFQLDNCSYVQRCGTSLSNYSHPWRNPNRIINGGQQMHEIFRLYTSTKQLKEYNYKIRLRCENSYNSTSYTTIYSNWAHISDY